jgi:glycosyltransferase involved in cell wall biosynthesis
MKIALISDWYLPRIGGLEMQMRDLARELCARGHDAHVITATPGEDALHDRHPRVHRLDVKLAPGLNTIRSTRALAPLEAVLRRERFDVLHCHTALSPLSHGGAWLGRKLGIPSVMTEHSVLRGAGAMLLGSVNKLYGWGNWPDVLTAVSNYVAKELKNVTGKSECLVLPNGVNSKEWAQATVDQGEVRVVTTMRLTKR